MKNYRFLVVGLAVLIAFYGYKAFAEENKKTAAPAVPEAAKSPETISAAAVSVDPETVIATVNDHKIKVKDYQELLKRIPANYQSFVKNQKSRVVNDMISQQLLYQEAAKQNLGDDKVVQDSLENIKKQLMVQRLLQKEIAEKVTVPEKDIKDYYDSHKEEFLIPERVKASHILVKTKEEAEAILARVKKNEDFGKLAKELSIDPSKVNEGDIGYFEKGRMIPEFENAAFALKPGEVSGVVQTKFGFHIIKVTDKKPAETRKFEEISNDIKNKLTQEKQAAEFNNVIQKLKAAAKVTVDEKVVEKL